MSYRKLLPNWTGQVQFEKCFFKDTTINTIYSLWYNAKSLTDTDGLCDAQPNQFKFDNTKEYRLETLGFNMPPYKTDQFMISYIKSWLKALAKGNVLKKLKQMQICHNTNNVDPVIEYMKEILPEKWEISACLHDYIYFSTYMDEVD